MRGLELLREAVDGRPPEPDPVDELLTLAKTFGAVDVAKQGADHQRGVTSPVELQQESGARLHKTLDVLDLIVSPLDQVLAVAKTARRVEPPGLHHTSDPHRNCHHCEWRPGADGLCKRFNWPVDRDEVCRVWGGQRRVNQSAGRSNAPGAAFQIADWIHGRSGSRSVKV